MRGVCETSLEKYCKSYQNVFVLFHSSSDSSGEEESQNLLQVWLSSQPIDNLGMSGIFHFQKCYRYCLDIYWGSILEPPVDLKNVDIIPV